MKLDANNNQGILYRIAKSNLQGKKLYSFFSFLSIALSVTFVTVLALFLLGTQTAEKRMLDNMQQVMFMDVTESQMEALASDSRTELMIPYKEGGEEFTLDGVKYSLNYLKSQPDQIQTYTPAAGREPESYQEIVVDKGFMEQLGKECTIGEKLVLPVRDKQEEFVICGYTDSQTAAAVYSVYVSRAFANQSEFMKDAGYTALVRIQGAADMESSGFETTVYQMAVDYGIRRSDVNINGRFEESLQAGNGTAYLFVLISLFIMGAGAIVIYSIFYLSVTSRTTEIGQLQTIGMTQKQIKRMVRREGLLLSSLSVPLGLALGSVIAYVLESDGWNARNTAVLLILIGSFELLVVQISIQKPASLAARVSPIEAARNTGTQERDEKKKRTHRRLTAFVLAKQGLNQKKRNLMTASLAFGGILFMIAASYLSAWDRLAYSREGEFEQSEYQIEYLYNAHNPAAYGPTDLQLAGHLSEELEEEILAIPHVKSVTVEHGTYGNLEYQGATWNQGFYRLTPDSAKYYETDMEGNHSYEYLTEHDGVIITNSEFISGINGVQFQVGDSITLHWFDGEEHTAELQIAAIMPGRLNENTQFDVCMTDQTMEKLWGDMNTADSFSVSIEDYEKYGDQVEQRIRALVEPYGDLALQTLRERIAEDAANIQKIQMQIYGICGFIILFSILNLVNLVIGNIATRRRELSMLESIGMEERQIRAMLFWESIQFVLPAILCTVLVGGAAGYGVVAALKQSAASYLNYQFPAVPAVLYAVFVILIPVVISYFSLKGQEKTSLVERIKYTD